LGSGADGATSSVTGGGSAWGAGAVAGGGLPLLGASPHDASISAERQAAITPKLRKVASPKMQSASGIRH
jgi:hypothetical protein